MVEPGRGGKPHRPPMVCGRRPCLHVYRGRDDRWYWRLWSGNIKITADGSQGYKRRQYADAAARSVALALRGEFDLVLSSLKVIRIKAAR